MYTIVQVLSHLMVYDHRNNPRIILDLDWINISTASVAELQECFCQIFKIITFKSQLQSYIEILDNLACWCNCKPYFFFYFAYNGAGLILFVRGQCG